MSHPATTTRALYDHHATGWVRTQPTILSDYTARPRVLERAGNVKDAELLDLGCGEGYLSPALAERGARSILAIDQSGAMIQSAIEQNRNDGWNINYQRDSATTWHPPVETFDLAIAIFLLNYLTVDESVESLTRARLGLKPGGKLILTVPHPALPWLRRQEPPFYFAKPTRGYSESRDVQLEGRIWARHGESVPVRCRHKTFDDLMGVIRRAGFVGPIHFEELGVTPEHLALDPDFFGPLKGTPLHMLIEVSR